MAERDVIIDGYNLVLQSRFGRFLATGGQLMSARMGLVRHLSLRLEPAERKAIAIIFDAKDISLEHPSTLYHASMRIEYASAYAEADDRIEEIIKRHGNPQKLLVVSSDRRLQNAASKRSGRWMEPLDWLEQFDKRVPKAPDFSRQTEQNLSNQTGFTDLDTADDEEIDLEKWLAFYGLNSEEIDKLGKESADDIPFMHPGKELELPPFLDDPFPPGYAQDLLDEDDQHDR